ncbi:MAG: ribosomal protein S18-alanine N-acetyltransferase [Lactobacillus sp.]|uniref:ribosomal protein S18-alanine N-acetyltransferase n=1 Tax=Lactobacillus sp. TaxID=1591 RepID=UPI0023C497C5|nr:ribosomal protein S18-alanine N-acetyltransferase [Lactobacillus sp.]MDE7049865.1 ribosomal protein S18-alanine N-acetyltransferase [Lactobacillus sp.]
MLRKFSLFFHPEEIDLSFSPFALRLDNQTYQIMKASDENIADLLGLEQEVYFGRTPWSRFSFKSELKKHANSLYLVVYQGSTLVGFIGMRMQAQEGHITNIAVKPAFQRRGIGEFLLRTMIEIAQRNHAVQMTLEVRSDNYNAQSLYRKIGFRDNFIRKNYYLAEHADAVSMIKKIADKEQEEVN